MAAALETAAKEINQQIGLTTDGSQFLTFQLGEELYGVDILRVQEIKGTSHGTRVCELLRAMHRVVVHLGIHTCATSGYTFLAALRSQTAH